MKSGGGKNKGNSFEREMAVELSLWLTHGTDKNVLWRTASSGALATQHAKAGRSVSNQVGDLNAIAPEGFKLTNKYIIELKFYKDLELQNLIYETNNGLPKFWETLLLDSKRYNKHPMLIAKQNRFQEIVCLDKEGAKLFGISLTSNIWRAFIPTMGMYVCFLKDFLEHATTAKLESE